MSVNIIACRINPLMVGHPPLFAIGPVTFDSKEFMNLYVHGLKRTRRTTVV